MLRLVAPAGAPVKSAELLRELGQVVLRGQDDVRLREQLAAQLQMRHIFGVSSGRAALWLILKVLARLRPERDIVAFPAYTCYSVAAAIARSGLKMCPVEMDPESLDFNFTTVESLPARKLLCLVTGNLFGFVSDVERLERVARGKGAFLVDDAAQAFGASRNGRQAGTAGDVGFYSLAGGKALGSVQGGLIVTNSDAIAGAIREEVERLGAPRFSDTIRVFGKTTAYAVFLQPRLFWIPWSLPFLKLGKTEFEPGFPVSQFPRLTGRLLRGMESMVGSANGARRANAADLAEHLATNRRFRVPQPAADCRASYIRFPVLAPDSVTRQQAVERLQKAGIGATSFYPSAICDIAGIERYMASREFHCPGAEEISRRLFTLPTHAYVGRREIARMAAVLRECGEE